MLKDRGRAASPMPGQIVNVFTAEPIMTTMPAS